MVRHHKYALFLFLNLSLRSQSVSASAIICEFPFAAEDPFNGNIYLKQTYKLAFTHIPRPVENQVEMSG